MNNQKYESLLLSIFYVAFFGESDLN